MRHTRLLLCLVVSLLVACSQGDGGPTPSKSATKSASAANGFLQDLGKRCSELGRALRRVKDAKNEAQLERETGKMLRAMREFHDDLAELDAPPKYRDGLRRYTAEIGELLKAHLKLKRAASEPKSRAFVTAFVGVTTHQLEAHRVSVHAGFPATCLLGVTQTEVAVEAFRARASLVCFDFTTLLKQLARRLDPKESRAEAIEFFKRLQELGLGFVKRMRAAIPPELHDTRLLKMTKLYGEAYETGMTGVLDALRLGDPLLAKRAIRRFADLAEKANKIAHAFGLPPCGDILHLGGSRSSSSD